jgi:predicted porin
MKKTLLVAGLFFLFVGGSLPVLADELDELDLLGSLDIEDDYQYEFPEIPMSAHAHLGYRFVDLDGSSRVFEYEYLEDSITFGGDLRSFKFPHRFYLDFDFANKKDYFGDLRYAYGDLILFRWLNNTFYHNLDTIRLYDYDPLTPSPGVDVRDAGREYGVNARENKFHLMLKAPNFPLHAYFDGFYLSKDGDLQQRNLLGSGFFNNMQRVSQSRNSDNTTRIYTIGANSHLGLVEVDIAHIEKRFDVDSSPVLEDAYTASGYRPAGIYEHSRIPELEGSGNTIKIHSSYTGQWVASASIFQNDRENNYSGAKSDVLIGAGSLRWNPMTSLAFALRYTHRDLDNENPASAGSSADFVKIPVSSNTDTLSLIGRYRPKIGLNFRAKYDYQKIDRTSAGIWNLPDSTQKNAITLTADSRLHRTILLNLKYAYKNVDDPAYNTEPEHSNAGRLALTWLPHPSVNLLFSYDLERQERDNLNFAGTDEPWYREADLDNAQILGTYQVTPKITLTGTYSYFLYEVVQDLAYENLGGDPQVDKDVPMEQKAHVFTVGATYQVFDALRLLGEFSYTRSEGGFYPNRSDLLEPFSIASFSRMEQSYFLLHLAGQYQFENGLSMDLDYRYADLEDRLDNIYDDVEDGKAHIVILSATKKW